MTKPDFEDYYGDEQDGVIVKVFEQDNGKWRMEAIVDCDTAGFVDTLSEDEDFDTAEEARMAGKNAGVEWCVVNGVDFE